MQKNQKELMAGSMTTFGTDGQTEGDTDRQTDGVDYIGPAIRPMRRVQKGLRY